VRRSGTTGPQALVLGRLGKLPTAAISDALDREGIPGTLEGLVPLSDDFRVAGPAFTIRYTPADSSAGTVGDFLDEVPPGAVIVIDNNARRDVTVWGGILTEVASIRGIAGTRDQWRLP
jgi:regulator of RNase E activity RraA